MFCWLHDLAKGFPHMGCIFLFSKRVNRFRYFLGTKCRLESSAFSGGIEPPGGSWKVILLLWIWYPCQGHSTNTAHKQHPPLKKTPLRWNRLGAFPRLKSQFGGWMQSQSQENPRFLGYDGEFNQQQQGYTGILILYGMFQFRLA